MKKAIIATRKPAKVQLNKRRSAERFHCFFFCFCIPFAQSTTTTQPGSKYHALTSSISRTRNTSFAPVLRYVPLCAQTGAMPTYTSHTTSKLPFSKAQAAMRKTRPLCFTKSSTETVFPHNVARAANVTQNGLSKKGMHAHECLYRIPIALALSDCVAIRI